MEKIQELGRSFLLIEDITSEENEFMSRMLEDNMIDNVVPFQRGLYENKTVIKLDVTNQSSLSKEYENKLMESKELKAILYDICGVVASGQKYLLEEEYFCFEPEYIFRNPDNDRLSMVYLPFNIGDAVEIKNYGRYYKLADFFLEKIRHTDEIAVDIAYKFYRMAKEEFFSISGFCESLEKENKTEKNVYCDAIDDSIKNQSNEIPDFKDVYEMPLMKEAQDKKQINILPIAVLIISISLMGIYKLFLKNNFYGMYVGFAGIILMLASVVMLIKNITSKLIRKREVNVAMPQKPVTVDEYWGGDKETVFFDSEETCFFDKEDNNGHVLKWEEKGEYKEYKLKEYPAVIGKKYDSVDICISDDTVSRKHAKLIVKHGEIFLSDLGSRNGTYVNERKLLAGENIKIESSSQIRFGKVVVDVV